MQLPPPGARVSVLWTDGRSYPGTALGVSQGLVHVRWDAGGAPVWVPPHACSPLAQAPYTPPPPVAAYTPAPPVSAAPAYTPAPVSAAPAYAPAPVSAAPAYAPAPAPAPQVSAPPPQVSAPPPQVSAPPPQVAATPAPPLAVPPPPEWQRPAAPASGGVDLPHRTMAETVNDLPRGLVFGPTAQGPGSGKAFFFFSGFLVAADSDMAMRMTDIDHVGDDVAALTAAGYTVVFDLHGDLAGLQKALAHAHPEAPGLATAGIFWSGHGHDDGTVEDFDGNTVSPDKLEAPPPHLQTVKLLVLSACYVGNHAARWQAKLGQQAVVIGWGAPITNQRAVEFLTPDEANTKGFDDLLAKHLGARAVTADGPLLPVKRLAAQHEDRAATRKLSFDDLVAAAEKRKAGKLERMKNGDALFLVGTAPSKDRPGVPRAQAVRVMPMGVEASWVVIASTVGPYTEALDLTRALNVLRPFVHMRLALVKINPPGQDFLAVETIFRRRGLHPTTLVRNIFMVADQADLLEDLFFGSDQR